jgi:hypothetical protein
VTLGEAPFHRSTIGQMVDAAKGEVVIPFKFQNALF